MKCTFMKRQELLEFFTYLPQSLRYKLLLLTKWKLDTLYLEPVLAQIWLGLEIIRSNNSFLAIYMKILVKTLSKRDFFLQQRIFAINIYLQQTLQSICCCDFHLMDFFLSERQKKNQLESPLHTVLQYHFHLV